MSHHGISRMTGPVVRTRGVRGLAGHDTDEHLSADPSGVSCAATGCSMQSGRSCGNAPDVPMTGRVRLRTGRYGQGRVLVQPDVPDQMHGTHLGRGWVYLAVADPDVHCDRAREAGAEVVGEPHGSAEAGTARLQRARSRGQPLELRHRPPRRLTSASRNRIAHHPRCGGQRVAGVSSRRVGVAIRSTRRSQGSTGSSSRTSSSLSSRMTGVSGRAWGRARSYQPAPAPSR